jgi:hypothetical protein
MPRPYTDSVALNCHMPRTARDKVSRLVMKLGYVHGGNPAWNKFFAAIASGELVVSRPVKIDD